MPSARLSAPILVEDCRSRPFPLHAILCAGTMRNRTYSRWAWMLAVLLGSCASAQGTSTTPDEQAWRGAWVATVGPHSFRGRWWGQLLPNTHNAASGSWTLLSDRNQILLEGTWSARKSPRGWEGTWLARLNSGRTFSGTWTSDMTNGKTFEDMLEQTLEKQVTGSWRSARMQGNWWLMGPG